MAHSSAWKSEMCEESHITRAGLGSGHETQMSFTTMGQTFRARCTFHAKTETF
jgi:hypothetical protein